MRRAGRLLAAGALLLCALAGAPLGAGGRAGAEAAGRAGTAAEASGRRAERIARPGLPNLGRVAPGIYRGGRPTREGWAELREIGIRTVVSLRERPDSAGLLAANGLRGVHIPMDPAVPPTPEEERRFLDLLDDTAARPVFVHCQIGRDRTGVMVALYRVRRQGWTSAEAIREMRAYGHSTRAYPALERYVRLLGAVGAAASGRRGRD